MAHKRPRAVTLKDITSGEVCLNTLVSQFLNYIYPAGPPPLPVLSPYHELPLWELFDAINAGADELKLPGRIVKTERYKVLKALYDDLGVLKGNEVWSSSDWTIEKREVVMSLTNEDGTKKVSGSTIALLEELNKDDGPQSARKGLLSLSYVGENNYLVYVACPLVDRILKVMEEKMASHTKEVQNVTSYMNAPVPSAYDDTRPDIMLTTLKNMHFVSVKVKADSSQLALAFDEALKAGFFLTPLTGYSAIIMAVAGTKVLMGLHTLLPHPTDIEETSPAASRGPRVWMQSARDLLPAMNEKLKGELNLLSTTERIDKIRILSKYRSIVYPLFFDFHRIPDWATFDTVFSQYLQILVDPICFGILSDATSVATFLEKSNNQCQLVMCEKPLADKYRLPGCPAQFVAKLNVVHNDSALERAHEVFDCEIYKYAAHRFTITTKATTELPASPSDRNTASASAAVADVHTPLAKQSSTKSAQPDTEQKPSTSTAAVQGVKGNTLITYIYRKFEGSPLDKRTSIAQFVDLMGALIVLHDKEGVYHCDVRRPNIIVKGDSLQLIDYEYCIQKRSLTDANKIVPLQLQGIRTAQFFSGIILGEDIKGACSFTERRYVQLLDIWSLFYFVSGVGNKNTRETNESETFFEDVHELFDAFITNEKKNTGVRTTSEILKEIFKQTPSKEIREWEAVKDESQKRKWFDGISTYKDFCKSHLQTR